MSTARLLAQHLGHVRIKGEITKMWNKLIALALTLPMTIAIAHAQAAQDADITAYSQDIAMRISRGQQMGQLTPENYNSIQSLYNNVENIRRSLGNKPMNAMVRTNVMNSLTNIDKQLTTYLHDDVNSRWQMWDPNRRSWRNQWWRGNQSGGNSYNGEIEAYQNSLKQRIDQGRNDGKITRSELNQLMLSYNDIDRMQQQYRAGGFSSWERNSLMAQLTKLDREITSQVHDNENSHYQNWNSQGNSWSNKWWQNSNNSDRGRDGYGRRDRDGDGRRDGNWRNN